MKLLLFSLLLLTGLSSRAQTFDEWFRQRKTKREYLVQQIAALQAYAGTLRQGYEIARYGINTVQHIKNGDLGLHQAFFGSLQKVNPTIASSARVADILSLQVAIIRRFGQTLQALRKDNLLLEAELAYLEQVKAKVLEACYQDLEALWLVLSANQLEMKDEERFRQLEALHAALLDKHQFTQAFLQEAQALALQRAKEKREAETGKRLHGIPQ
ncbi:hypothetical protein FVR03_20020 [Pontibacter qinzhouensis]|uniref:TerB family tellurite resistance protein n=1 Tax=Pontibacter qinzhouensis TaxID=2603253 RepID=A0A5C8J567_9BACT|nr:hypothetical protein [Pontibacter qinzhouensis]TXK31129.1 hypothetical protein FVR03_20020 [Pontibacter qinzhouensis]